EGLLAGLLHRDDRAVPDVAQHGGDHLRTADRLHRGRHLLPRHRPRADRPRGLARAPAQRAPQAGDRPPGEGVLHRGTGSRRWRAGRGELLMTTTDGPDRPMVQMRDIVKRFGSTTVLDGIDLDVAEGEVVTLIGPSGAGKSTLLRCVNGLERIT